MPAFQCADRAAAPAFTDVKNNKAGAIKWGEIGFKPIFADVSPDGGKIAVAAELDKPRR